jgi:hypothetical protein
MTPKPATKHTGVSWHKVRKAWRVSVFWKRKHIYLGCYRDEELAAWVADFARYLFYGMEPAKWHQNVGRPNGPPRHRADYPRFLLLTRLSPHIEADVLADKVARYDAVVRELAGPPT